MEARIAECLYATFANPSESKHAEQVLGAMRVENGFIEGLISLIVGSGTETGVRHAALLYFKNVISNDWEAEYFQPIKKQIFESFPEILLSLPESMISSGGNLTRQLLAKSIQKNEWPGIIDQVQTFLRGRNVCIGLIMAKAITAELHSFNEEFSHSFIEFIVPYLVSIKGPAELMTHVYHCASRILSYCPCDQFISIINSFSPDSNGSTVTQYLKLCAKFVSTYKSPEILVQMISTAKLFLSNLPAPMVKVRALKLLHAVEATPDGVSIILNNADEFIHEMMLPIFAITEEDALNFVHEPESFVMDQHRDDDPIGLASSDLCILSKSNDSFIVAMLDFGFELLNQQNEFLFFSGMRMLASVARYASTKYKVRTTTLINSMADYFNSGSDIIKAGCYMFLSFCEGIETDPDLAVVCYEHISDPCPIVGFYAASAFALLIQSCSLTKTVNAIHNALSENAPNIVRQYLNLSIIFRQSMILSSFSVLAKFFEDDMVPYASSCALELVEFFSQTLDIDIIPTLNHMIYIMAECKNNAALVATYEKLAEIPIGDYSDEIILMMGDIVKAADFDPVFWNFLNNVQNDDLIIDEVLRLYEILLFKDEKLFEKESVIVFVGNSLISLADSPEKLRRTDLANCIAGMIHRVGFPSVGDWLLPKLLEMISKYGEEYDAKCSAGVLLNAILVETAGTALQTLAQYAIEYWVYNNLFPDFVAGAVASFHVITDQALALTVLERCFDIITCDILMRDEDDEFDQDIETDGAIKWYMFHQVLLDFYNLACANSTLLSPEYAEELPSICRTAELYFQTSQKAD